MAKHNICAILSVFSLFIAIQINVNHARELADLDDELVLEYMCLNHEKLAKIHFYVQDITGGPNTTAYEVARAANSSDSSLLAFGTILAFDDLITAEPGADSERVGKYQGIITSVDMETTAMLMNTNILFTSGKYNGSTVSIGGRNHVFDPQRRLAVVGGTGVFRYTRGYAVVTTYSSRVDENSVIYTVLDYTIYATFCESH